MLFGLVGLVVVVVDVGVVSCVVSCWSKCNFLDCLLYVPCWLTTGVGGWFPICYRKERAVRLCCSRQLVNATTLV